MNATIFVVQGFRNEVFIQKELTSFMSSAMKFLMPHFCLVLLVSLCYHQALVLPSTLWDESNICFPSHCLAKLLVMVNDP